MSFLATVLSLETTQSVLDKCLSEYLKYRLMDDQLKHDQANGRGDYFSTHHRATEPDESAVRQIPVQMSSTQISPQIFQDDFLLKDDIRLSALVESPGTFSRPSFDDNNNRGDQHAGYEYNESATVPSMPLRRPPLPPPSRQSRPAPISHRSDSGEHIRAQRPQPSPHPIAEVIKEQDRYEIGKRYFKPLEDYINGTLRNAECLNASFVNGRFSYAERTRSEGHVTSSHKERTNTQLIGTSEGFSELDRKTLLLGNVAENGSWWTGGPEQLQHPPEKDPKKRAAGHLASFPSVSHRSARINWHHVTQWYSAICNVDRSWQARLDEMPESLALKEKVKVLANREELLQIDSELRSIRHHFRRIVIKATDDLLKRPGYPLREPNDIRFLLIILANPLFHSSESSGGQINNADISQRPGKRKEASPRPGTGQRRETEPRANAPPALRLSRSSTNYFGLVEKALGLLSNLSPSCHNQLISWFSRYDEEHFQNTVDLVLRFVTYRLTHQTVKKPVVDVDPTSDLIPELLGHASNSAAQLHAALGLTRPGSQRREKGEGLPQIATYSEDWRLLAAARVMSLLFIANNSYYLKRSLGISKGGSKLANKASKERSKLQEQQDKERQDKRPVAHGQLLPTSHFYISLVDYIDVIADFEAWQSGRAKFTFAQYHFFISLGAKTKIMEHDAQRQMETRARDAFFNNIFRSRSIEQYFQLKVRRNCLIDDSLGRISEVVGAGQEEVKKGLRVHFANEEGVDAGGLRKEWFLLLVRELFDPNHGMWDVLAYFVTLFRALIGLLAHLVGMFIYEDEDSRLCYFNPHTFEKSEQYFLVGAVVGLAIYNSTILDVPLPSFAFKKLLAGALSPYSSSSATSTRRSGTNLTLDDLAEYRPSLAKGLRDLVSYDGDVEADLCRNFVIETDKYGERIVVPLCPGGEDRPLTNENRYEFVDLYVKYLLDTAVARQFGPFQRGFYTVSGGRALGLFRPEEIELLVRGSDEVLDVSAMKAVAVYENWPEHDQNGSNNSNANGNANGRPGTTDATTISDDKDSATYQVGSQSDKPPQVVPEAAAWFWQLFETADAQDQRKILSFITGSDRVPAQGPASLTMKVVCLGEDCDRFPVARTCFNMLMLYRYSSRKKLVKMLWRAVLESEGFGLK